MDAEQKRYYYKYEYGYINIDSRNIYLTNSGNWTETSDMQEKSPGTVRRSNRRKWWILSYLVIGSGLIVLFHLMRVIGSGESLVFMALVPLSCLPLYRYMRNELGQRFLIPIKKVISIEEVDNGLRIHFRNEAMEEDSVYLEHPRGLDKELLEHRINPKKIEIAPDVFII